jgi:hypothetical protein
MPEVNAEQRQRAKAAAANAAVAANDTAVVLGIAGVVVAGAGVASGVGALAGVGVGAALGVCSFGAWFVGNRYQRIANDPARTDFDQVAKSVAALIEDAVPAEEPHATVHRLAAHHLLLGDALNALLVSLERFDGAIEAGDGDAASRQADAVAHNAQVAVGHHGSILGLADSLNQSWRDPQAELAWDAVTPEEVQQFNSDARGDALPAVLASIGDLTDGDLFAGLDDSVDPVLNVGEIPAQPEAVADDAYLGELVGLSEVLPSLVVESS